jgi:tetratricopeptide (TPR) repeat protein
MAVIVAAPLILLLAAEFALRIAGAGYPPGFFVRLGDGRRVTNEKFGWRFFPRQIARAPDIEVFAENRPQGAYRIFVLGESAAMGVPEPAFSFGRILEVILEERYPGVDVEVVNAAMTAINSHAILPIAREAAAFDPDLFVVYMGNNEVVGPYGPGTVFTEASTVLPLIRFHVWASSTRIGQAAASLTARRRPTEHWRGMEMFLERRVPADDPRLARTYSHFRHNLESLLDAARRAGARVILSTVATNLLDCPPFSSGAAESHYRQARQTLGGGDLEAALRHARRARDLDELRFRADSRINGIIREVGTASPGVTLVDAAPAFDAPDAGLFYEHVHLTFAGNYLLARTVASHVTDIRGQPRGGIPSLEAAASALAYTPWDEHRMAAQMNAMMERPPFTNQLGHESARRARLATLQELEKRAAAADNRALYAAALRARPEDVHLRSRYAELLRHLRDFEGAAREWRSLTERVSGRKTWHTSLGAVLTDSGRFAEAEREHRSALAIDPDFDLAWFGLGVLAASRQRNGEAAAHYRRALEANPSYAEAHNNLGAALEAQGRASEALPHFQEALRLDPGLAGAHRNLARALAKLGRTADAVPHVQAVLRAEPGDAEAHFGLAGLLVELGQLEPAAVHYRAALEIRPDFADAHYNLGLVLSRSADSAAALKHYREALRLNPAWPEAHNNMGTALARRGRYQEASLHFRKALEIRPDFAAAKANLERAARAAR